MRDLCAAVQGWISGMNLTDGICSSLLGQFERDNNQLFSFFFFESNEVQFYSSPTAPTVRSKTQRKFQVQSCSNGLSKTKNKQKQTLTRVWGKCGISMLPSGGAGNGDSDMVLDGCLICMLHGEPQKPSPLQVTKTHLSQVLKPATLRNKTAEPSGQTQQPEEQFCPLGFHEL